jgi:hypothetical protein
VSNNNAALFAVGPAIDANGQLTYYSVNGNVAGATTVTVAVNDSVAQSTPVTTTPHRRKAARSSSRSLTMGRRL